MGITHVSVPTCSVGDDVVARAVGDEMVLLNLESGTYFTLNAVGALVWRGLENSESIANIVGCVISEYEVSPERATADVQHLISSLLESGLLSTA